MEFFQSDQWLFFLQELRRKGTELHASGSWPSWQLQACGWLGVFRWFAPKTFQGLEWRESEIIRGYLDLSRACLTTAFILTQRSAAMKRIVTSSNPIAKDRWLPGLVSGECFGTIGISHLTTSQQSSDQPSLKAIKLDRGYELHGFSPWITGAAHAQVLVVGATLPDKRQCMFAVPADATGVFRHSGKTLVALTGSCTDRVDFDHVMVDDDCLLDGPQENLVVNAKGGSTGGLQTSTLAVGLATEAIQFIVDQSAVRPELESISKKLLADAESLQMALFDASTGIVAASLASIRQRANSLVLRATQAALTVAKGTGFVEGHPVGMWARQALFFLVWSCPQDVARANLCELAGLESF